MSRRTSRRVAAMEVEVEPPARPKRGVPEPPPKAKEEMSDDQVAELWSQFAGDHYEIVEQLPLELHRNSRLLRELDSESLSQQTRLQARVREYVTYRIKVAQREEKEEEEDIKPRVTEAPELVPHHGDEALDVLMDHGADTARPAGVAPSTPTRPQPEETDEHAEAAVEAALEDLQTPRPVPAYPKRVNLGEISSLISELVRNREEKVAIAVGAYNTIDRHIRALDSALSAHETSVLGFAPSVEPQPEPEPEPEPEPGPKKKGRKRSVSASLPPGLPPGIEVDPNEPRYCYCNQVSYGEMVGCDNDDCPMEWFHLSCLGLTHPPAGEWMCDVCRKKEGGTPAGGQKKRRKR
ncbi:hypothetical protein CcaverHIS631_0605630 [Cutaneotrichosporon cavernicola]|nr:hypothetical protein CcaverHIS631_0605630 [Cutaneotrichosporon cavernicola]BEJ09646.1 hypothetical protein CcaverHIS641_0605610 [Cutaneotrichosporon cavernicola]